MKPLTIEELKALDVGDYVWFTDRPRKPLNGMYVRAVSDVPNEIEFYFDYDSHDDLASRYYADYGTKWVVYKNKEQAEAKGEIVELPCKVAIRCMQF